MATASVSVLDTEITNPLYINYLKASLGLIQVQRGLSPFISRTLQSIHSNLIANVGGSSCGSCTLDTLQLHSNCKTQGCLCTKKKHGRHLCPANTCGLLYDKITAMHRKQKPNFNNTIIWKLYNDFWEFGKCFLPGDGYDTKLSSAECDATGLLSIIINCNDVAATIGAHISVTTPMDVFSSVKAIRNKQLFHASKSYEMSEVNMKSALDTMEKILKHGCELLKDDDAKKAAAEIVKLKAVTFKVTRQMEKEVMEEKLKTVEIKLKNVQKATEEVNVKVDKKVEDVDKKVEDVNKKVEDVDKKVEDVNKKVEDVDKKVENVDKKVEDVNKKVENVDKKFEDVDKKVEDVNKKVENVDKKVEDVDKKVEDVNKKVEDVDKKVENVDKKFEDVDKKVENVDKKVEDVDKKFEDVDKKVEDVNQKVENVDKKFEDVDKKFEDVDKKVEDVDKKVENVDKKVEDVDKKVENVDKKVEDLEQTVKNTNNGRHKDEAELQEVKSKVKNLEEMVPRLSEQIDTCTVDRNIQVSTILSLRSDISAIQDDVDTIKQMYTGLENSLGKLATSPPNKEFERLKAETKAKLNVHRKRLKEEKLTFNSRLTTDLTKKLREQKVIVLTGKSGIGKTHEANNILAMLQDSDYTPVMANNITDVQSILPNNEHICIMVNDIFGRFSVDTGVLEAWSDCLDTCLSHMEGDQLLMVITINNVHLKQCMDFPKYNEIFVKKCINLEQNGMTRNEKDEMICHFDIKTSRKLREKLLYGSGLPLGLPLLCKLANGKIDDISALTEKPLQDIIKAMEPTCYVALLMTLFSGESFSDDSIKEGADDPLSTCFTELVNYYKSHNIDIGKVSYKSNTLLGSYLEKTPSEMFRFMHDSVLEATFKSAVAPGRHHFSLLVKYCHLPLVVKLAHHIRHKLRSNDKLISTLLERFKTEKVPAKSIGSCSLWLDTWFQQKALQYFKDDMDFFTEADTTGESLIVMFAALGLTSVLKAVLDRVRQNPHVDKAALHEQVKLALLRSCSHGHQECVSFLLQQPDQIVSDEHLFECLRSDNSKLFIFLLEKGGNVRAVDSKTRRNLFHQACAYNRHDILKLIKSKMSDCEVKSFLDMKTSDCGETPLCVAVKNCDMKMVIYLQEMGCDIAIKDTKGQNLLHLALLGRNKTVIEHLLEKCPEMITEESCLMTTLHYAALWGSLEHFDWFINDFKLDPTAKTYRKHCTMLHIAAVAGSLSIIEYLCKKFPGLINLTDCNGWNAAHYAACEGHLDCLVTLLGKGIVPESQTSDQSTILHLAATYGRHSVVEYICKEFPVLINLTNANGWNAAHHAASEGHLDCLVTLLQLGKGIDPESQTSDKLTILHLAVNYGRHSVVEYICKEFPGLINLTNANGWNAAHYAACNGHLDCLVTLLGKGIDPESQTSDKITILHLAAVNGRHSVVEYICKEFPGLINLTNANVWNAAHYAACNGHLDCLVTLLGEGFNPESQISDQSTILHVAANYGRHSVVEYICNEYPGLINLTNANGWNAAHYAACNGHLDCLVTLLGEGFNPESQISDQSTILHVAANYGRHSVVEYICKEFPGLINLTNANGWNAAHYAACNGHLDCLVTLLGEGFNPESQISDQSTILHLAANYGRHSVVEFICNEYPGLINLTNANGLNAAHYAACNGHLDCLMTLLGKGINPES